MTVQAFTLNANDPARPVVLSNLLAFLPKLPADKPFRVEIKPYVKPRSDEQNAALFAVAYGALAEFIGLRGEDEIKSLHRDFCCAYFGTVTLPIGCKPRRTTTRNEAGERDVIDPKTFADFYNFVQQKGAEIGCYVPDPDPTKSRKFPHRAAA